MVVFTVLGALVLLTLFIGVVVTAMEEAKEEQQKERKAEQDLMARIGTLGIRPGMPLQLYRNVFDYLDWNDKDGALHNFSGGHKKKKTGKLDRESLNLLMRALPHISDQRNLRKDEPQEDTEDTSDASVAQRKCVIAKDDIEKIIQIADEEYSG